MRNKLLLLICLIAFNTSAQSLKEQKEKLSAQFKEYKTSQQKNFEEYRKQLNAEYAKHMRQAWTEYKPCPPKPVPLRPEPPKPVVKEPGVDTNPIVKPIPMVVPKVEPKEDPKEDLEVEPIVEPEDSIAEEPAEIPVTEPEVEPAILPFDEVVPPTEPAPPVEPVVPLPEVEPVVPSAPGHEFDYYGTACKVSLEASHRYTLSGVGEDAVADVWQVLSDEKYLPVLAQCADYRTKLNLCDWGYIRFLQEMTESFFPSSQHNEAVLMQAYLLVQSGYKVRMARTGDRLVLLLPIEHEVYNYSYLMVDGIPYYVIDQQKAGQSFYLYDRAFAKEASVSLYMPSPPMLKAVDSKSTKRTLTSRKQVEVTIETDNNLIDFYNDYPISAQWGYYAYASLSPKTKSRLYPALEAYLTGLDEAARANLLLNFVQTAFDYKIDQEQFGYERPLFGEESLYYPYCDCEDRSILYSILVRDLLGLDVVLLHFPEHLATAVRFNDEVAGDRIMLDGKPYVVCDPTYIGANIGETMPDYKNVSVIVQRIGR